MLFRSVAELCRRHGISRKSFYIWKERRDSGDQVVVEGHRLEVLELDGRRIARVGVAAVGGAQPGVALVSQLDQVQATPAGLLDLAPADAPADLTLVILDDSPLVIAQALMQGDKPKVRIEGDVQLAAEINWLADHVRWDLEEDLARLMGDAPAHTLVQAARNAAAPQSAEALLLVFPPTLLSPDMPEARRASLPYSFAARSSPMTVPGTPAAR